MATKPTLTDPLIPNRAGDALQKFGKLRLKPSLAIDVVAEGDTFLWVRATWTDEMNDGITSWQDIETRINGAAGRRG